MRWVLGLVLMALAQPAWAESPRDAFALEAPEIIPPLLDSWTFRAGATLSGLFNSNQGRPFVYFDLGLRLKNDVAFVDIHAPVVPFGFDMLFYAIREALDIPGSEDFARAINEEFNMVYFEPLSLKLGRTFVSGSDRFTLGLVAAAEFVFFQALISQVDPEEFRGIDDRFAVDPLIVLVGGFVSWGQAFDDHRGAFNIAVGGGPDVFTFDAEYQPNSGAVIFLDSEVAYQFTHGVGGYIRPRLATYTHLTDPLTVTLVVNFGLLFRP